MNIFTAELSIGGGSKRVAIKDNFDIQGLVTHAGSEALVNTAPATEHAGVIEHLLQAGCQIIGKTAMHELAFGVTGINKWQGTALNPKFPDLIPGGSSSGSAAVVAANLVDFSIGTDTGGSVRVPACCCGVYGLKPTFGRVSRKGIIPQDSTLDVVGPFANSMSAITDAMTAIDPTFIAISAPDTFSIGLLEVDANPVISEIVTHFLQSLDIHLSPVKAQYFAKAYEAGMHIINAENWLAFNPLLKTGLIGKDVATRIQRAKQTSPEDIFDSEKIRALFTNEIDTLLEKNTVIALPTMPDFPIELINAQDTNALLNITSLVRPFNLSGHPAISIPLLSTCGRPVGLQLVAKKGEDALLCAISTVIAQQQ